MKRKLSRSDILAQLCQFIEEKNSVKIAETIVALVERLVDKKMKNLGTCHEKNARKNG